VDVRDASRRSLLLKAIRHADSFAPRNQLPDWFEPFLLSGPFPEPPLAAWLLLWSCRRALPRIAQLLLAKGVSPNARIDSALPEEELTKDDLIYWTPGGTGLHMTASSPAPSTQIVQLLLGKGADPAVLDRNGDTPLVLAIWERRSEIIELLLASTCSSDAGPANLSRQPVLLNAVGDEDLLRRLVTAGAAPGSSDAVAALHHATYKLDWRSLTALLDAGVPIDSRDEYGRTPLLSLSINFSDVGLFDWQKSDRLRCWKLLLDRGADVAARDPDDNTALHHIAMRSQPNAVVALLAKNPNVNAVNDNDQTPLMRAGSVHNAELLLQHGADPNAQDRRGFSPLAYAILYRGDDIAAVLTTAGANQDGLDRAHLLAAIKEQNHESLKQYLRAGVDPNTRDPWDRTALYVAAALWDADAVNFLLEAGADVNARSDGCTPLWAALTTSADNDSFEKREKFADTVAALLNAGASLDDLDSQGNSAAHLPFSRWWSEPRLAARLLHVCAAKVNDRGETPLMHVTGLGRLDELRRLINTGIDINAADAQGRTALFRVFERRDRVERARLLLDHGAHVNAADHSGQTPLIRAAIANDTDLIHLFIQYRADPHHLDNAGKTARYHALTSGKLEAHNLLLILEQAASATT
jgi:ankyrin